MPSRSSSPDHISREQNPVFVAVHGDAEEIIVQLRENVVMKSKHEVLVAAFSELHSLSVAPATTARSS